MRYLNFLHQGWKVALLSSIVTSPANAAVGHVPDYNGEPGCFKITTSQGEFNAAQFDGNLNEKDVVVVTCEKAFIIMKIGEKIYPLRKTDNAFVVNHSPPPARQEDMAERYADMWRRKFGSDDTGTKKGPDPCQPLWQGVPQLVARSGKRTISIGLRKDCEMYRDQPVKVQNDCGSSSKSDWKKDDKEGILELEIGGSPSCKITINWGNGHQETLSFKEDASISELIGKNKDQSPSVLARWLMEQKVGTEVEAYQLVVGTKKMGAQLVRELITTGGISPQLSPPPK